MTENTITRARLESLETEIARINAEIGEDDDCIYIPSTDDGKNWVSVEVLDFDGTHDFSFLRRLLANHGVEIDEKLMDDGRNSLDEDGNRTSPSIESGDGMWGRRDCRLFGYTIRVID